AVTADVCQCTDSLQCEGIAYAHAPRTEIHCNPPRSCVINGCTSSPDGMGPHYWGACCDAHDVGYCCPGGPEQRLQADQALRDCINAAGGPGNLYYAAVRVGGCSYFTWDPWQVSEVGALCDVRLCPCGNRNCGPRYPGTDCLTTVACGQCVGTDRCDSQQQRCGQCMPGRACGYWCCQGSEQCV